MLNTSQNLKNDNQRKTAERMSTKHKHVLKQMQHASIITTAVSSLVCITALFLLNAF